ARYSLSAPKVSGCRTPLLSTVSACPPTLRWTCKVLWRPPSQRVTRSSRPSASTSPPTAATVLGSEATRLLASKELPPPVLATSPPHGDVGRFTGPRVLASCPHGRAPEPRPPPAADPDAVALRVRRAAAGRPACGRGLRHPCRSLHAGRGALGRHAAPARRGRLVVDARPPRARRRGGQPAPARRAGRRRRAGLHRGQDRNHAGRRGVPVPPRAVPVDPGAPSRGDRGLRRGARGARAHRSGARRLTGPP